MPGGSAEAYETLGPILASIAAVADGEPCVTHVGTDGAGHFVKMVHNGIEYADMQLIAEAYDLIRQGTGKTPAEIADIFAEWNTGELESYLIEITAEVLRQTDAATGKPLVDVILDEAGAKGTGAWTVQNALDLGVPASGIAEAVFARSLSSKRAQREAATDLPGPAEAWKVAPADADAFIEDVRRALYASKIIAYSQGFDEIVAGAEQFGWDIHKGDIAKIWRAGCIIRARFLNRIAEAYAEDPALVALVVAPYFRDAVAGAQDSWRRIVAIAAQAGIPTPAFSSSLAYYDGLRAERLPAALDPGPARLLRRAHVPARRQAGRVPHAVVGRPQRDRDDALLALVEGASTRRRRAEDSGCRSRRGVMRAPSPTTASRSRTSARSSRGSARRSRSSRAACCCTSSPPSSGRASPSPCSRWGSAWSPRCSAPCPTRGGARTRSRSGRAARCRSAGSSPRSRACAS